MRANNAKSHKLMAAVDSVRIRLRVFPIDKERTRQNQCYLAGKRDSRAGTE